MRQQSARSLRSARARQRAADAAELAHQRQQQQAFQIGRRLTHNRGIITGCPIDGYRPAAFPTTTYSSRHPKGINDHVPSPGYASRPAERPAVHRRPLRTRSRRRTASPARPSSRSCWRCRTGIRASRPGAHVGVWCATKLATDAGGWRQINRAGYPMMWPIFWPDDTRFTYPANTRHPSEDFDADGKNVAELHRRRRRSRWNLGRPAGLRRRRWPESCSRSPALRRRNARDIRLRHPQRPDSGRQRARGHALARRRHRSAVRAQAVRGWATAGQELPLCPTGVTGRALTTRTRIATSVPGKATTPRPVPGARSTGRVDAPSLALTGGQLRC